MGIFDVFKTKVSEVTDKAGDVAGDLTDKAGDMAGDLKDKAEGLMGKKDAAASCERGKFFQAHCPLVRVCRLAKCGPDSSPNRPEQSSL